MLGILAGKPQPHGDIKNNRMVSLGYEFSQEYAYAIGQTVLKIIWYSEWYFMDG